MSAPRLRRVDTRKQMENLIDDYVTQGYEIVNQGENNAMVRFKTWGSLLGHIVWGALTIWFTAGIGNLIYALISRYTAERVMLKVDGSE